MIRDKSQSPLQEIAPNRTHDRSEATGQPLKKLSTIDSIETKENSPVNKSDIVASLQGKTIRRSRKGVNTLTEKRFRGAKVTVARSALQLQQSRAGTTLFFRCFHDRGPGASTLPQAADEDCDTDEESAGEIRESLLAHLEQTILGSR